MSANYLFLYTILLLDIVCIIAVIFFERKNPASTIAWVLVLILAPIVGIIAYMIFGNGFPVRKKKKKYSLKAARDSIYDEELTQYLKISNDDPVYNNILYVRMIDYLKTDGDGIYTDKNQVQLFLDGKNKFESLLKDIRSAKDHIHLFYYIFKNDHIGKEVLAALEEKAKEGLRVKVMYDGLGTMLGFSQMFKPLIAAGGKVLPFSPLLFNLSPDIRVNYRNHRKIVVIDGQIGYMGGMNIGDEYLGRDKKLSPWRDTHLRLTGPVVWFLQERFFMDWLYALSEDPEPRNLEKYFPEPLPGGDTGVQVVSSGPDRADNMPIKSGFLQMIYDACKTILIQTPYFIPDDSFIEAMRIAARSGVNVRLMIPGKTDNILVQQVNMAYAQHIADCGVKVYLYNGFLHAKTITCDGKITSIGTTNMDVRSFSLNFEVNAFIYDKDFSEEYARHFEDDIKECREVNSAWFKEHSVFTRAAWKAARLLAPLM